MFEGNVVVRTSDLNFLATKVRKRDVSHTEITSTPVFLQRRSNGGNVWRALANVGTRYYDDENLGLIKFNKKQIGCRFQFLF